MCSRNHLLDASIYDRQKRRRSHQPVTLYANVATPALPIERGTAFDRGGGNRISVSSPAGRKCDAPPPAQSLFASPPP